MESKKFTGAEVALLGMLVLLFIFLATAMNWCAHKAMHRLDDVVSQPEESD